MSIETTTRRRNGILAIVAGAALLVGGGTYALWSDTATLGGGSITAGNLALTAGTLASYDVSVDRADETTAVQVNSKSLTFAADPAGDKIKANASKVLYGHAINLGTWRIVPGDTAAVAQPFTVTLDGDNLVAALTLDGTTFADEDGFTNTDMVYKYAIFDANGAQIGSTGTIDTANNAIQVALFQADGTGQLNGTDDKVGGVVVPVTTGGTATGTVVVFAHFTDTGANQGQDNVKSVDALGTLTLTLTQVRDLTDNYGVV